MTMDFQNIIDISRTISPAALVYPGDAPLGLEKLCQIDSNCPCNITQLTWTTHFLTHVDPPLHFIEGGASLDEVPLHRFSGDALVIEVYGDAVQAGDIPLEPEARGRNLLFKTRNSKDRDPRIFDERHVYISSEAAKVAVARGVNLIGIDYISVDRFGDETYPAHQTLLGNGVLILEGLDLTDATPSLYTLIALPLKIAAGDGSPVRAILIPK